MAILIRESLTKIGFYVQTAATLTLVRDSTDSLVTDRCAKGPKNPEPFSGFQMPVKN
jgi:hypothetical protein